MKIIDTFVPCLFAFKYADNLPDELERIFDEWEDPQFLNDFFEENEKEISITIEEAIEKTRNEPIFLRNKLVALARAKPNELNLLFKNLNNNEYTAKELSQRKARNRWLRLYAIKIDKNNYVITGGAIKLDNQHLMQHYPHTNKELIKINKCRYYL